MIKRFLTVVVGSGILLGTVVLTAGPASARPVPPPHDDPTGEPHCAAQVCW